ncbi:MAG: hypothetical protein K6W08_15620, partial [Firmicutes bacterium]|nr:hypothetical protein [Bacillota bacterium]
PGGSDFLIAWAHGARTSGARGADRARRRARAAAAPGAPPPDLPAVRAHLERAGLARQKWPEDLRVVADFPRTASGKIQKFVLRQELRAEAGR